MKKKYWFFSLVLIILLVGVIDSLNGVPAFGRKYKMSCSVCHNPFPRLKDYGEEFASNGFVLKDKDTPRYYQDTGDDTLSLIRDFPLAVRLEGHIFYNNANTRQFDFAAPYLVKLLSGGALAKNISYYFYFYMNERGKVAGLEDAFIYFNDLFGSGIALAVGQFQVSDPLFKRELRLTFEDYLIYKAKPGLSHVNLAYDRGLMFTFGLKSGTDFTVEILNGSGIEEADASKSFDTDKYKNLFGRVSQGIGKALRVGGCFYYGKEANRVIVNSVQMWGVDATLHLGALELNAQYLERKDDNPAFSAVSAVEASTRGGLAELIYTPGGDNGKWYAVGLFNWVDSNFPGLDYASLSAHLGIMLRRNIRLVGEVTYIFEDPQGKHARAGIGLVTAF